MIGDTISRNVVIIVLLTFILFIGYLSWSLVVIENKNDRLSKLESERSSNEEELREKLERKNQTIKRLQKNIDDLTGEIREIDMDNEQYTKATKENRKLRKENKRLRKKVQNLTQQRNKLRIKYKREQEKASRYFKEWETESERKIELYNCVFNDKCENLKGKEYYIR